MSPTLVVLLLGSVVLLSVLAITALAMTRGHWGDIEGSRTERDQK